MSAAQRRLSELGAPLLRPATLQGLAAPRWLFHDEALGAELGLGPDWARTPQALQQLAGNCPWPGQVPLASVYAGHQFGAWVAQLGDGRAALVAERPDRHGRWQQLQLKGAGPTAYARGLDGRCSLDAALREALGCAALAGLGVPVTRVLAVVGCERTRVLPREGGAGQGAAVLCRVAPSFVRYGHFEWLAFGHSARPPTLAPTGGADTAFGWGERRVDPAHWQAWAARLRPLAEQQAGSPLDADAAAGWLTGVVEGQARLVARWQTLGFVHGVMNTDNMALAGCTLDLGPYDFMDRWRAHHVAHEGDAEGRYAWCEQPAVARWNAQRLLHACAPLLGDTPAAAARQAQAVLARHDAALAPALLQGWRAKLGLQEARADDAALAQRLLTLMQAARCDFHRSWRALAQLHAVSDRAAHGLREAYAPVLPAFDAWVGDYRARLRSEGSLDDRARAARMNRVNPLYVLRRHLLDAALRDSAAGDLRELHRLLRLLAQPWDARPGQQAYAGEPTAAAPALAAGCAL